MKIKGIYRICCLPTGVAYIGSSVDVASRLKAHRFRLDRGTHENRNIQAAWDKHKEKNFRFELIEKVNEENLTSREQFWIDKTPKLFNIALTAGSRPSVELYRARKQAEFAEYETPEHPLAYLEHLLSLGPTYVARILGIAYPTYAAYKTGSRVLPEYHLNQVILILMLEENVRNEYVKDQLDATH